MPNNRPDHDGVHRSQFEKNKKIIYATQNTCAICGRPVDPELKYPHPMSRCIDHIIPIDKGGHPSAMDNLQLAHLCCNRAKADKLLKQSKDPQKKEKESKDDLAWSIDWLKFGM